ncbi:3-oxoacyl-ACP reductase [Mediterranea sp. An20]|uniref:SDR family NAD(P)-dependent oxidoreductase n=1 Tax=Mediterranea sp. An20 TaxID=1965586 RepID=UPI000B38F600|nr:SDR family oxidoreductase [Mediterranea sp. An20]OUP07236.1 3-oxoacyl-ACP reductase [Mediterranea sp. An20]
MNATPFSLVGKTILITGASSGIGRSTAIECSKMGARLVISGRNEKRLCETFRALEGDGHSYIMADLSDGSQLDELVEQSPTLDGLVNNAGITETLPTQFIKQEKLIHVLEVNTIAPIMLTQKLLKAKKIGRGSSIVFTGSISGTCVCGGGNVLYSTSKGAIHGFMKNAALDLSVKGIRVNEVCPGMIDTHILDNSSISSDMLEVEAGRYPMKRFGKPEEVAYGIIYLLSEASSFVTGTSLVIDGGFTLQ